MILRCNINSVKTGISNGRGKRFRVELFQSFKLMNGLVSKAVSCGRSVYENNEERSSLENFLRSKTQRKHDPNGADFFQNFVRHFG